MLSVNLSKWPFIRWQKHDVSAKTLGWIALSTSILASSTYYAFAKILTGVLSPVVLFFVSELLAGSFVVLSYGLMPVIRDLMKVRRSAIGPLIAVGLVSGTLAPLLLFPGLAMSSAVNASLFGNMEMMFLVILAFVVLHERFGREHVLSIGAMMLGMVIIGLRGFSEGLEFHLGDALLVAACLAYAVGSLIFRKYLHDIPPHLVLFVRCITAVSSFFVLSLFIAQPIKAELAAFPLALIPVLVGFAFISRFVSVFSFYESLDRLPVSLVSLFNNLSAISSVLFASWFLREPIEGYHWLGGTLLIIGALLLEVTGMHESPKHLENHLRQSE